jgi:hypothetical protein
MLAFLGLVNALLDADVNTWPRFLQTLDNPMDVLVAGAAMYAGQLLHRAEELGRPVEEILQQRAAAAMRDSE